MLSKAWPSPSAAYCLEATPPRAHHNDLTQMRKRPPKHDGKLRSFAQEEVAMPQACLVLVNKPLHPQLILRRTRHGVLAAKDSPIVLKCAVTSEFITSLKRSSTGVNCFLDTWTFFTSFWGKPTYTTFLLGLFSFGLDLTGPFFICFLHALLLAVAPRTEMSILGNLLCYCRWIDGSERRGASTAQLLSGDMDYHATTTHAWVGT
jgi:hypothetical protein